MRLDFTLHTHAPLTLSVQSVRIIQGQGQPYAGDYTVTPQTGAAVTLPTAGCLLKQDVVVSAIPQFAVSNLAGGQTLIIGEEYFQHGN